jgi:two-component system response regulator PilR (NtrC family)
MPGQHVLIVDDEPDIRDLLEMTLQDMGLAPVCAEDVASARKALADNPVQLCLTDMKMPNGSGMDLIHFIQKFHPEVPVAVITAHGSVESATEAMKAGAFDFVSKPIRLPQLRTLVTSALQLINEDGQQSPAVTELLGETEVIRKLREDIGKIARTQAPVMISGESGTGKELVARLIHARSHRHNAPFVPVNCGAIPSELMESEFFGYTKGSFTGASSDKPGLFEAAAGGTLFLDEIAELPLNMQVKLLRALQEKAVRPLGSNKEVAIDVRVVSASNDDLGSLVAQNRFRNDLFYRVNVVHINVPSLRDRRQDIPLLAEKILTNLQHQWGVAQPAISETAMQQLLNYHFPGNVRELENILERALTLSESALIDSGDLHIPDAQIRPPVAAPSTSETATAEPPAADSDIPDDLQAHLDSIERDILERALQQSRWNITEAAKLVGLSFRQMRYRLKKHSL